jgi:hypothetical protein
MGCDWKNEIHKRINFCLLCEVLAIMPDPGAQVLFLPGRMSSQSDQTEFCSSKIIDYFSSINSWKMKSINGFVVLVFLLINLGCGENSTPKKETPKPQNAEIKFQNERIDAGVTDGKTSVNVDFKFSNTGNIPLVINEVRGSCHCVQGTKPDHPIAPGDSSIISVSFDPAGVSTSYQRTLWVVSNATRDSVELYITGEIKRDPKEIVKKTH